MIYSHCVKLYEGRGQKYGLCQATSDNAQLHTFILTLLSFSKGIKASIITNLKVN